MERPLAVVINNNEEYRAKVSSDIAKHSLNFRVSCYNNLECFLSPGNGSKKPAQVYFISYEQQDRDIDKLHSVKILKNLYPKSAIVLTIPADAKLTDSVIRDNYLTDWLYQCSSEEKVRECLDKLRKNSQIIQRLTLGIIGSGRLARGVLKAAYPKSDFISKFLVFSKTINDIYDKNYSEFFDEAGIPESDRDFVSSKSSEIDIRVQGYSSLSHMLSKNPDVLLIVTGSRMRGVEAIRRLPTRKSWFKKNLSKARYVFDALKETNPQSLKVLDINPPGPLLGVGNIEYGFNPYEFTSFSAQNMRYRNSLFGLLKLLVCSPVSVGPNKLRDRLESLTPEEIDLLNFGEHGEDLPHLKSCKLGNDNLTDYSEYVDFFNPDSEERKTLINQANEIGTRELLAVLRNKGDYSDTPLAIIRAIEDIAHFLESPRDTWYVFDEINHARILWPTKLEFIGSTVKVFPDYQRLRYKDLEPNDFRALENQVKDQILYINNRDNPSFFANSGGRS